MSDTRTSFWPSTLPSIGATPLFLNYALVKSRGAIRTPQKCEPLTGLPMGRSCLRQLHAAMFTCTETANCTCGPDSALVTVEGTPLQGLSRRHQTLKPGLLHSKPIQGSPKTTQSVSWWLCRAQGHTSAGLKPSSCRMRLSAHASHLFSRASATCGPGVSS